MYQLVIIIFTIFFSNLYASPFEIIPLGVHGGLTDGNLSAYLIKASTSENYVSLDSGTLVRGLQVAAKKQSLGNKSVNDLLQKHIPAYLISHAHLDHLMGLLMAQPELREQQMIMAREETMNVLQKNIFTWSVWGNFGDSGEMPHLNFQHYQTLPLAQWIEIPNTDLQVKVLPLSHGGMTSSAFLIRNQTNYILYFGDTGGDSIEQSDNLKNIWNEVTPLIRRKQLDAIMIECSFLNAQPNNKLFGHLKPSLLIKELRQLAGVVNSSDVKNALRGLPVVVTHIKPRLVDLSDIEDDAETRVMNELAQENDLGVKLIKPEQGVLLTF